MSRYPRAAREAKIKCMECNAPVTETVDGGYACVDCGRNPLADESPSGGASTVDPTTGEGTRVDESDPDDESGTSIGVGD